MTGCCDVLNEFFVACVVVGGGGSVLGIENDDALTSIDATAGIIGRFVFFQPLVNAWRIRAGWGIHDVKGWLNNMLANMAAQ